MTKSQWDDNSADIKIKKQLLIIKIKKICYYKTLLMLRENVTRCEKMHKY